MRGSRLGPATGRLPPQEKVWKGALGLFISRTLKTEPGAQQVLDRCLLSK